MRPHGNVPTPKSMYALRGDRPIDSKEQDLLGRSPFARAVAQQIVDSPAVDSYVVAVMGPWGAGKTSLLNLIAEEVQAQSDTCVIRFNPWIFSGTEQLVAHFFSELGRQIAELDTITLSTVGASVQKYAELFGTVAGWLPYGVILEKVADAAKETGKAIATPPSVHSQREKIREQLRGQEQRVLVLVDDIDRLERSEIREVMKLVRLTGDFPNIVYLLAFDRKRVEEGLADSGDTGRAYLEKIVQAGYDVPLPVSDDLGRLLLSEIDRALEGVEHGSFDESEWPNVLYDIIRPLIKTPRDVARYVNVLRPTVTVIGKDVALVDTLALEAIRVFMPDIFVALARLLPILTNDDQSDKIRKDHPWAVELVALVSRGGEHKELLRQVIERLFPYAARFVGGSGYMRHPLWERQRRVATEAPFRFYLERRLPAGEVGTATVERAIAVLADRGRLETMLAQLTADELEDLLDRLVGHADELTGDRAEAAIGALLNHRSRLRENRQHFFDFGADIVMDRVVLCFLRAVTDDTQREAIVRRVIPTVHHISAAWALLNLAKRRELISSSAHDEMLDELHATLLARRPSELAEERLLGLLLAQVIDDGQPRLDIALALLEHDEVVARILASVMGESSRLSMGDRVSRQQAKLPWNDLLAKFGEDRWPAAVRRSAANAALGADSRVNQAMQLALRYLEGWRPNRDSDSDTE